MVATDADIMKVIPELDAKILHRVSEQKTRFYASQLLNLATSVSYAILNYGHGYSAIGPLFSI